MKRIPPRVRRLVYEKYNGHCAYCGQPIEYKDMQIDHIKPAFHNWSEDEKNRLLPKGRVGGDEIENYNPACRPCNFRKGTDTIEGFREAIKHSLIVLNRDFTYRMAVRYGLIEEKNIDVRFYFERQ